MKKAVFFALSAMLVAGCALGFNRHGDLVIVPTLPTTIEIDSDQPYYQDGYYYSYRTMYGFTRHHRVGLGTGCRVTTIRGKFTIGTMTTIGTMAITMIDDAYVDRR